MKYRRRLLKNSAKEALSIAHPKAWLVTLVYLLIGILVTGIFNTVSPEPLGKLLEPVSDSFEIIIDEVVENGFDSLPGIISEKAASLPQNILGDLYDTYDINPGSGDSIFKQILSVLTLIAIPTLISWALALVRNLINVTVDYGYCAYTLSVFRRQKASFNKLFSAFRRIIAVAIASLVIAVCSFLWTLFSTLVCGLLIAVVCIFIDIAVLRVILLVILGIASVIAPILILKRYALTPYLLLDLRDHGAMDCIDLSKELMEGKKWRLFFLDLSFLGWYILRSLISIVLLAIGVLLGSLCMGSDANVFGAIIMGLFALAAVIAPIPLDLWLKSYHSTAYAGFYHFIVTTENILAPKDAPAAEEAPAEETAEELPAAEENEEPAAEELPEEAAEELPSEDAPVEEAPAEEIPVEDSPVEEIPAEEAPVVDETPVDENFTVDSILEEAGLIEDASAAETPVEETPIEDTPVEEAPAEEVPAE